MSGVGSREIRFNGEDRAVVSTTVAELLKEFQLESQKVAVERNREIVPHSTFDSTPINAGDTIEVVQFVGGG